MLGVFLMGSDDVHVEHRPASKAQDRLGQRVVHQRVEPVAVHPFRRDAPDLADQVGVRPDRAAAAAEVLPERLVVDLVGDVQSPAIDAEPEPVLGDAEQVLPNGGLAGVQLGQRRESPPRPIAEGARWRPGRWVRQQRLSRVEGGIVEVEPAPVRRGGAILDDVVERPEAAPAVIEDTVEHDAHAPGVRGIEQGTQGLVAAEQRVDRQIVVGVIPMVGGGLEDRCQVERGDAQVLEVAQVLDDPDTGHRP